jgi:hypothetical protein
VTSFGPVSHIYLDDDPSGTPADTFTITVTVVDEEGDSDSAQADVTVTNAAPTADAGADQAVNEGGLITLIGAFTDPGSLDTHAFTWQVVSSNGQAVPDGTGQDFSLTANDNGIYSLTFSVTDDDGGVDSDVVVVAVHNLAPTASIAGPGDGVRGQSRTFTLGATDPSEVDTAVGFDYIIDWGDGTPLQTTGATPGNGVGSTVDHVFAQAGSYTVQVTATDKDGGTSVAATHSIVISGVAIQPDECNGDQMALVVGGTTVSDSIVVSRSGSAGDVIVWLNGASLGTFHPTGRIIVYGQTGDDNIHVDGGISLSAWLYGGDGYDVLKGGGGANVLIGGAGDDSITGGGNRDLLIGGIGADRLVGNAADDLLIAGFTAFDADDDALCAILNEWNSDRDYATRVANLLGTGVGPRHNENYFLLADGPNATLFDDDAVDLLTGSSGSDWFFANLDIGIRDKITDLGFNELGSDVDFI